MTKATRRARNPSAAAAKELRSLLSSLAAIRVLKYIADQPLDTARLRERLRARGTALDTAILNHTLLRMRRHGWLQSKNHAHSITPQGREALEVAMSGLKNHLALTHRQT